MARQFGAGFVAFALLGMSLMTLALPVAPASAIIGCPTFVTNNSDGSSYTVSIRGADGSCVSPTLYDSSGASPGRAHVAFSSGSLQNPYTITLVSCSGSNCPPSIVKILGWGPGDICGGSKPACGSLPISFTLDATVESGVSGCSDTAPLKVASSGASIIQIEGGSGCVPPPPPPTVPEFPFGLAILMAILAPALLMVRKRALLS